MKKIIYTREDGGVSIVIPAPKQDIEIVCGKLTDQKYQEHVWERSVPENAVNPRYIEDSDIPLSREFRDAWCDVTQDSRIDIDLSKAKNIQLSKLRLVRNDELKESDILMLRALEDSDSQAISDLKIRRQSLRNATESLKSLKAEGFNDEEVIEQIKSLGTLNI